MVVFAKMLLSGKVVVFVQKLLCSGKSGCVLANVVVFVQADCIWAKWFCSCKVGMFGQVGCIREKVVVIGQNLVVFGQKRMYSDKSGCNRAKVAVFGKMRIFG